MIKKDLTRYTQSLPRVRLNIEQVNERICWQGESWCASHLSKCKGTMFSSLISVLPNIVLLRQYSGYFNLPRFCEPIPRPLQKSTSNLEWSFLFPFYTFYHVTILSLKYRRHDSVTGLYWFIFSLFSRVPERWRRLRWMPVRTFVHICCWRK